MRHTARAVLAGCLLAGFYAIVIGIVLSLVVAAAILFDHAPLIAAIPAGTALLVVMAAARTIAASRRGEPGGLAVSATDEPALWQEVALLADRIGTRAPNEIRLVAEVNAAVSEETRLLGLVGGTRRMYVGVPLLLALSPGELRAVLAHELGHYSRKHTTLGPLVYRGQAAIERIVLELGRETIIGRLLSWYGRLYVAIAFSVTRRQELEADEFSAELAGAETAASALQVLAPLSILWGHFVRGFATLGDDDGVRPSPLFDGFVAMLSDPDVIARLAKAAEEITEERSAFDTHPPTSERVARLRALGTATPPGEPASTVPSSAALGRLESQLFEGSDLRTTSWDDALAAAAARDLNARSHELARLIQRTGNPAPTIGDAARRLSQPRRLGLLDDYPADDERRVAAEIIGDAVALAMIETGAGSLAIDWVRRYALTGDDGSRIDPWGEVRAAATSRDPAALLTWAAGHGVDTGARLDRREPPQESESDRASQVHGFVAPIITLTTWHALLVMGAGLFVVPLERNERTAITSSSALLGSGWRGTIGGVLARLVRTHPADLLDDPRTIHLPWRFVARVDLTSPWPRVLLGSGLTITLTDGTKRKFRVYPRALSVGEPWEAVAERLGDRLVRHGRAAKRWPSKPAV